jgi:uncharacterized membrane protein
MSHVSRESALRILGKTWEDATELERRVVHAVVTRARVSRPIHREMAVGGTLGDRLADRITTFAGSWTFIGSFFLVLAAWMSVNTFLAVARPFDPYPFILLNLVLSCLAAIQAPVILMSQDRQADRDRMQATHDYEVNLKAEIEIMQLHEKIELLRTNELERLLSFQETQARLLQEIARATASPPAGPERDGPR